MIVWFADDSRVVALFAGDKARMGDVFYDRSRRRCDRQVEVSDSIGGGSKWLSPSFAVMTALLRHSRILSGVHAWMPSLVRWTRLIGPTKWGCRGGVIAIAE